MGFFRPPLFGMMVSMLGVGPLAWWLRGRRSGALARNQQAANAVLTASMCGVLLCVHAGLSRFYPIIGSKSLATEMAQVLKQEDAVMLDGELTSGSTLLFYARHPLIFVNGRVNGPWFGSFWPDAPGVFTDEAGLHRAWASAQQVYLLTYEPARMNDLRRVAPVRVFAASSGKIILTNR